MGLDLEVGGEVEVTKVDLEGPAPDGDPLEVAHLLAGGKGEGDVLLEISKKLLVNWITPQ